jgi:hypothetical protein
MSRSRQSSRDERQDAKGAKEEIDPQITQTDADLNSELIRWLVSAICETCVICG